MQIGLKCMGCNKVIGCKGDSFELNCEQCLYTCDTQSFDKTETEGECNNCRDQKTRAILQGGVL